MAKILVAALAATTITLSAHSQLSGDGGPIRVKADRSEVLDRERKVLLIDNVDITQGDARLRADVVTLEYAPANAATASGLASGFGDIRTMTARGNVFYVTPDLKANGGLGVYNAERDVITLTGDVILVRGEDVARGQRLVMDLGAGRTVLDGSDSQVNMVIIPGENTGR
ncbi:MAG: LptA/OstA family protein [Pseudomonadota bacterium]